MLGKTHFVFGILLGLVYYSFGAPLYVIFVIPIASLFLDVDEPHSYVGRRLKLIGALFSHRGFFHSIWFLILSYALASLISPELGFSIIIAYLGHLLLDGITKAGINPFWPIKYKLKGPIRVGGWEEKIFLLIIFMAVVISLI